MPHVTVKMIAGRSEAQKQALTAAIAEALKTHAKCSDDSISMAIEDIADKDAWTAQVYNPEIAPQIDKLYKKPGYKPA